MTKRYTHIPHPIVNSPFAEPNTFWQYESVGWIFSQEPGRRPASVANPQAGRNVRRYTMPEADFSEFFSFCDGKEENEKP